MITCPMDLKQLTIDKYETREELILNGIWKGEIYKNVDLSTRNGRGWLWKTLVIDGEGDMEEIVEVPTLTEDDEQSPQPKVPKGRKDRGIRRLTPIDVKRHPLSSTGGKQDDRAVDDDDTTMKEKLEIIDLDLSRLMLDDIFQEKEVHNEMRKIMYNYLIRRSDDCSYKQGYHELLGMIYLQLHEDKQMSMENKGTELKNILFIFEKLMKPMSFFYNENQLIKWENKVFQPLLRTCCPKLYGIICCDDNHTNLLWLLRWTRLLFMRELPRDYTLVIWDHLLTFLYPADTFVACVVVVLLLNNYKVFTEEVEDHDDLVELMLHFNSRMRSMIDCVELCKMAGKLCEYWYVQDAQSMKTFSDNFLKIKFNVDKDLEPDRTVDPNRIRIEEKLRRRVKQTLLTSSKDSK